MMIANNNRNTVLITASALLLSLSFHPLQLHFLAWFGLVPLLYAIEGSRPSQSFRTGILFGFLFSMFTLFWIVFLQIEANIKMLMVGGLFILFLYIGFYFGISALVARKVGFWSLPLIITGLEYVRSIGELGFPWLTFGYSQARYPLFIQQAAIYGVYGISLWLMYLNVAVYSALKKKTLRHLLLVILIFFLPVVYGISRPQRSQERIARVGIVQPNIDPNLKFSRELRYKTFERLMNLSVQCMRTSLDEFGDSLDLIVWPETATPVFLKSPGKYQDLVRHLVDRLGTPIFTGTAIYESQSRDIFNGAVLIEPNRGINQDYRKIHLVPFGEHIPFDHHIPILRKVDFGEGDYTPGTIPTVFEIPEFKFSCLICFESIFPGLSRQAVNDGAEILTNITNDGWFGKISGAQQHNNMAILRSVENGVVLLRSANTGISMIVDQYGRVMTEKSLFVQETIVGAIYIDPVDTLYRKIGDLLPILCLLLTTILAVRSQFFRKK
ncbi:MAG: apolipoprotein N-acyltransferase [candidate division WOR-3 bacterium]|nr:MAG: apolipoprotein N-acyltransferase [candidate division WOR-3 bacterium]